MDEKEGIFSYIDDSIDRKLTSFRAHGRSRRKNPLLSHINHAFPLVQYITFNVSQLVVWLVNRSHNFLKGW